MISTHILDTAKGTPASNVRVSLQKLNGKNFEDVCDGLTNSDGRHSFEAQITPGTYQIVFSVDAYLKRESKPLFYSQIPVVFTVEDSNRKYHIPLLLSPFGYSTYRGS